MPPPEGRVGAGESGGTGNVGCVGTSESSPVDRATLPDDPKNGSRPWNHSQNFTILTQDHPTNQSKRHPIAPGDQQSIQHSLNEFLPSRGGLAAPCRSDETGRGRLNDRSQDAHNPRKIFNGVFREIKRDQIAAKPQKFPGCSGADSPVDRFHRLTRAVVADPSRHHRRDTVTKSRSDQVVFRFDDGDRGSLEKVLTRASTQDEVAVSVQPSFAVHLPLHTREERESSPQRSAKFQKDRRDDEFGLRLLCAIGQRQQCPVPDEVGELGTNGKRRLGGEQISIFQP